MRAVEAVLDQIRASDAPVLIEGETGTGKEILARELHARSPRAHRPFLKLNCALLPLELLESTLQKNESLATREADQPTPGLLEMAGGGTVLLDEIGDMDIRLQSTLVQLLQENQSCRLGRDETTNMDIRIVAATHRNLEQAVANGAFRGALYFRLNVIHLGVPPLRERREDILPLAEFFLSKYSVPGASRPVLTAALKDVFLRYFWPGNVRELENTIRRLIILQDPLSIVRELQVRLMRRPRVSEACRIEPFGLRPR